MQFTDLHLGEKDDYDVSTAQLMYQIITNQNPQLSVITGDIVSGSYFNSSTENWFKNKWAKMQQPFTTYSYQYAITFGINDTLSDQTKANILALETANTFR